MISWSRTRLPILITLTFLSLVIHFYRLLFIDILNKSHFLNVIHARFCYIPIVLGAFWYGFRGGMLIGVLVSIATYLYIALKPVVEPNDLINEYTEIFFYVILGGLSGIVLDRERALEREKDEAEQKLELAERFALMGKMAASIAHEIKNPLGSIKGAAQILNDQTITESDKKEFTAIIEKEADRLDSVVGDILSYSRSSPTHVTDVSICNILENAQKQLRFQADKQGIKLEFDAQPIPSIKADGDKLHQVFLNVILNAVQAMPDGGKITMSCGVTNDEVVIEIADCGPGIPVDVIDKIFDPFFSTKGRGTGLGLATARSIIEQHKGTIRAESEPGKGARFIITLPLKRTEPVNGT